MAKPIEILVTLPIEESLINTIRGISPRLNVTVLKAKKPEDIPDDVWEKTEVLYTDTVLPTEKQAPLLRWIQFHWAGVDFITDAPIFHRPGIVVTTLSGAGASQLGEYILMALLALGHKAPAIIENQRASSWPSDRFDRFAPLELRNSTVGIVGYGSIGRQVARLLRPFGATVLAVKRDAMKPEDEGYSQEGLGDPGGDLVHRLYPSQALRSMLKECDFIVVCVPLTSETKNLIGDEEFSAMRQGTYLVDVSRGGIVDHTALLKALKSGKLAGAVLDVFPQEPLPPDNPLWSLPNIFVTPHISGFSKQYDERAMELFSENLHRYLGNLSLYNQFDPKQGY